jgi:hypothetical protein
MILIFFLFLVNMMPMSDDPGDYSPGFMSGLKAGFGFSG